jgi:hypothetical protein
MADPDKNADIGEESIETVRDILMGDQSREFKRRFSLLEGRVTREIGEVRDELRATFEPFKQFVRSELASLGATLSNTDGRLDGQGHIFDSKLVNAEEKASQRLRQVEENVIERARQLSDEIRKRNDIVMTAMRRAIQELDSRKPDRAALAALLSAVAAQLSGETGREKGEEAAEAEERSTH